MEELEVKRFNEWAIFKEKMHNARHRRVFREGEIWWVAVGENVGVEINGKGPRFSRPVLIINKFGRESFVGIPLTTQQKSGVWYATLELSNRIVMAALSQTRLFSVYRLLTRMGRISDGNLELIKQRYLNLFKKKLSLQFGDGG